jgi:hypothetical protein
MKNKLSAVGPQMFTEPLKIILIIVAFIHFSTKFVSKLITWTENLSYIQDLWIVD